MFMFIMQYMLNVDSSLMQGHFIYLDSKTLFKIDISLQNSNIVR